MAQTKDGAIKCAAKKAGITAEEYLQQVGAGLKKCTYCKKWKPKDYFSKDRSRYDGLKSKCRDCDYKPVTNNIGFRERRLKSQQGLRWCRRCQQWLNLEIVTKNGLCRPHEAEDARSRYASNDKYRRARRQHTYSRKRACEPITPEVQIHVSEEFDGKCAYCQEPATTFDHIIPITKGGSSKLDNIVPACAACNSSKKNKDVFDWIKAKHIAVSAKLEQCLKLLIRQG